MDVPRDPLPHAKSPTTAAANNAVLTLPRFVWWVALAMTVLGFGVHHSGFNEAWLIWAHTQSVIPASFWACTTLLGFGWAVLIVVTAFDREHGRWAAAAMVSVVIGGLLIAFIKRVGYHPRPFAALDASSLQSIGEPILQSGSMPSGHAAGAGVLVTLLVLALRERGQLDRTRIYILMLMGFLVAWSRVAVGAHWPADVMVGAPLGMALAMGAYRLVNAGMPKQSPLSAVQIKHRKWWLCTLELALAAVCFGTDTGQPLANGFQGFIGSLAIMSCLARLRSAMGLAAA